MVKNVHAREAGVEGSGGGGGCKISIGTSHRIVADTYCVRVTAHSPSPSLAVLRRHASTSRTGEQGFLGDKKQMCLLPLFS